MMEIDALLHEANAEIKEEAKRTHAEEWKY